MRKPFARKLRVRKPPRPSRPKGPEDIRLQVALIGLIVAAAIANAFAWIAAS